MEMNVNNHTPLVFRWVLTLVQPSRSIRHKPWVPQFRLLRGMQPFSGPPDMESVRNPFNYEETAAEMRARLRKNGFLPPLIFQDRPINIGHSGQVTDPYEPPEGDGRESSLSFRRLALEKVNLLDKGKSYKATLKIRRHEPTFNPKSFALEAESIYKEAHDLLQNFTANESRLFELVTEKALVEMTEGLRFRTLRWKFVSSIEPPHVVQVRTQELMSKENLYGQVTVRFHTQQILAVYDRFGRLLFGNPAVPVDVLEYIVMEKHITDEYGIWRLHSKIPAHSTSPKVLIPTQRLLPAEKKPIPASAVRDIQSEVEEKDITGS
ncbi:Large subunit ribosomal protein L45 [Fasciola gigantica]|uniref:Large ribosomal subunit protein mL45 n=1 Tax=Fasciola gigantica TaxID=46835 RepID=A0A504YF79_FASGI|nr:Large subunit ribosomal protein L45 [Fasciola gigantica]